jgi:hypothetical protein
MLMGVVVLVVQDSIQIEWVIVSVAGCLGEGARTTFDAWKVFSEGQKL